MRRQTGIFFIGLAGLSLWGCGGGGGNSVALPPGDPLASGRAALNQVATGASPSDTGTFQSILDEFTQALQQNPNSPDAHFGAALCLAGQIGDELDNVNVGSSPGSPGSPIPAARPASNGNVGSAVPPSASSPGGTPVLPAPPTFGDVPPAPPGHTLPIQPLPPRHQLGLLWNLDSGLANPYALLNMLAPLSDLQRGLIPYYGYPSDASDISRRQKLLAKLNIVEQHLQAVEADPNFSTTLPDPNRSGQMVTVGLPEVYLFDAYVNSLRTEVALSLAYVRDPGGFQIVPTPVPVSSGSGVAAPAPAIFATGTAKRDGAAGPPVSIFQGLDKNADGKLSPDEYLPPSPYLTLRDAALLTTAQQALQAVGDKEAKGISGVLARPADGVFLVSNTTEVQKVLTEVRDHVLPLLQQAAVGPVTLEIPHYQPSIAVSSADAPPPAPGTASGVFILQPGAGSSGPPAPPIFTPEKVTINLAAWFTAPPADLKKFAPTYTLGASGLINFDQTVYPDPTFGGLYPDGLPKDLIF